MSKDRDRTIYRRPDGTWANERNDANRASSLHGTQKKPCRPDGAYCKTKEAAT